MSEPLMLPRPLPTAPTANPAAVIQGKNYRITLLTDGLLRLEYAADGAFEDRASSFALFRNHPVPEFQVLETEAHLEILTARVRLIYDRGPFTTSGLSIQILGDVSNYHSTWRFGETPSERDNLGGTARTLDEADGRIALEPGVASFRGFAVIDDSRSLLFESDGWVAPRATGRTDLYFFGYGLDYPDAVRALYQVSGPTPVLPRFTLGNWWSRYHPYSSDHYRTLMERFRAAGLPFSVGVLDMDWHLVDIDPEYGSGWTGYTWNRELIPDPEQLLTWLHDNGLRITLNVHPADGVRAFEDAYPAMASALGVDPTSREPIAFDVTNREFMAAYFQILHRRLEDQGVDFWWLDWQSGPHSRVVGIDPLWMLNHFHFLDSARQPSNDDRHSSVDARHPSNGAPSGHRPLTFSRYAGPGSHRYPIGFSGDTVISWASLAFQPEFTATASNIGYGWWSHDIGGHMFGYRDEELTARWVQLGTFSPILRLHSSNNRFIVKEPWTFGPETQQVMTSYLRLRHRLVPYLHTMNHRAARAGTPLVQPVYWLHPRRSEAYEVPNQYFFGVGMLVVPITTPADPVVRMGAANAWLPPGEWTDMFTGRHYAGDRWITLHREFDDIPVLVGNGAIVPLDAAPVPGNDPVNPVALEILVAPGADGFFEMIEDDGTGDGLADSSVVRTPIRYHDASRTVRIGPAVGNTECIPVHRSYTVTVLGTTRSASREGATTTAVEIGLPTVVGDVAAETDAALFRILERAHVEHELKLKVYKMLVKDNSDAQKLSELHTLGVPAGLQAALGELLSSRR